MTGGDLESDDRGKPASLDRATGEVHGSGAGAGGGNPGEDYDSDAKGGGGDQPEGSAKPIDRAEGPPKDKHQGIYG